MFLIDTNIWLERMLDQEKSDEVKTFLASVDSNELWISDFSLHSIGVILARLKQHEKFSEFITDLFEHGNINLAILTPSELITVLSNAKKFDLDFDDAYQVTALQKNNLKLVTLDKDFRKSGIKSYTPLQALRFRKANN
ncbi:MAG: PIN domain-containing protein [Ignavibacteriaceae bacterium]|nr:PIN domain-containing protein [Ignavibacteriaceae bacterium]